MQISSSYNSYNYYSSDSSFKETKQTDPTQKDEANSSKDSKKDGKEENGEQTQMVNGVELSQKEAQQVRELQSIDRNVKAHEAAHQAAGGGLAGAASFTYTRGPDNQMYATAGEVPISMQKGNTPEETIANARQIQAAAMAPADPSPQDYKVAANATKMEFEARAEAMKIKAEEAQEEKEKKDKEEENKENTLSKDNTDKTNENSKDSTENFQKAFKNFVAKSYEQNLQNNEIKFSIAS
ncbi:putative metalloprotease CJM1_0395 family protein [Campylobacter sp. VTCC 70190]|uniref:putative metalloprotease CJM1_0395 family protein n=1 Tax=Campylobacter sp. VTCC 70190 TaxID=3392118 RepID=UPI00398EC842